MTAVALRDRFTARELAEMGLPGLPSTDRGIQLRAEREGWDRSRREGFGGGWEYPVSALPKAARQQLLRRQLAVGGEAPAVPAPRALAAETTADLKGWQRDAMDARAAILLAVDRLSAAGGISRTAAAELVVEQARAGALPPALAAEIPKANAKPGRDGRRTLSRGTLLSWLKARDETGPLALAPRAGGPVHPPVPAWAPALVRLYARPQKPSLAACLEQLPGRLEAGVEAPSYDQAKRFLRSMSTLDRNRGRMGPRELKSLRAHVVRDFSDLWPTAIYVADGHKFDAEVAHPRHGRPFRPEVTVAIDVATRRIAGWSAGLSENAWGVADAMRHACEASGVPAIWYVDRGSGFNNAAMDDPATGFLTRLGVRKTNSLPYNSQARGVVERVHQSCLVRAAKQLPTYLGAAMDAEARQAAFKITRADIRLSGRSRLLVTWPDFVAFVQAEIDAYNARRHSTLGRSPDEQWAKLLAEQPDTVIDRLAEDESADTFRPYEERVTRRGQIELWGGTYFLRELEHVHGERVRVGYDLHDSSRVWVRGLDDRLIGIATLDGNKRPWMPQLTRSDQIQQVRTKGRLARVDARRAEILEELNGAPAVIDARPATTASPEALAAARAALLAADESAREVGATPVSEATPAAAANDPGPTGPAFDPGARPRWRDDVEWVVWMRAHPERMTAKDRRGLVELMGRRSFRDLLELRDIDVAALDALAREARQEVA